MLGSSKEALVAAHDVAMLDLDGVVYISDHGVPHAAEAIERARAVGMRIAFVTNNASRAPDKVADRIIAAGVPAEASEVVTSAQAAARLLLEQHGEGARILVLGAAGLHTAVAAAGLEPIAETDAEVAGVVTGYGPDVRWRDVMRTAARVRDGLPWVASNADYTLPTDYGPAPGHGVMVEMLRAFTGATPAVAGKPERPLLDETIERTGAQRPLMVGDRLDTDIEGAHNAGVPSLLVMTGVTGLGDLVAATPALRPTYIAADLRGLLRPHAAPAPRDGSPEAAWVAGGWTASVVGGSLRLDGAGEVDDWWAVSAAAAWAALDATGTPVDVTGLRAPAEPVPGDSLPT